VQVVLAPFLALVAALVLTPQVRRLAFRVGALDSPDPRKVHQGVMPRLGGLAVYASFVVAVLVALSAGIKMSPELQEELWGLLAGATLITAVGVLDDVYGLSAWAKLAGQVAAAVSVLHWGILVKIVSNPFGPGEMHLGALAAPMTVVWLVAVVNAVNLIDGLDGLASGTSVIAAVTMAVVILVVRPNSPTDDFVMVTLALTMAAATTGFWKYNFHPARIFLGDSGSMLLGFLLGTMAVMGLAKQATTVSVMVPMVILGIPLADTVSAVIRRCSRHRSILAPDREHLHHRLLDLGLSHRQAVLAIYGVDVVLGGSAVLLAVATQAQALLLVAAMAATGVLTVNKLEPIVQLLRTNHLAKEVRRSRGA